MKKGNALVVGLIVFFSIIVLSGIIIFAYFKVFKSSDNEKQEQLLSTEVFNMQYDKEIDDNIITKGNYVEVEKLLKNYFKEYNKLDNELKEKYNSTKSFIEKCLQAENISKDGPEFVHTKNVIKEIKNVEKDTISKMEEMKSNDYIEKQANSLSSEYNKDLFKYLINEETYLVSLKSFISSYDSYLDSMTDVFEFLTKNKDHWAMSNGMLMFDNQELLDNYNSNVQMMQFKEISVNTAYNALNW